MKMLRPIDPHVHLRGIEYEQPFAQMAFEDADKVGLYALGEMPNPTPNLITSGLLSQRHHTLASIKRDVKLMQHMGTTTDPALTVDAFRFALTRTSCGAVKAFFSHSTGNMGILAEHDQRNIWKIAASVGYTGVIMGRYENEDAHITTPKFDPEDPVSHSHHQPESSEMSQVIGQIRLAKEEGFAGTMYICHVSSPKTVDYVLGQKSLGKLPFKIVMEATWHHLFLNWDSYGTLSNLVKMNPPLRSPESQQAMLDHLHCGHIDLIGSDHAPHPLRAKCGEKPASGIPTLPFWPRGVKILHELGLDQDQIDDLIQRRAALLFDLSVPTDRIDVEYEPSLWDKYGWDPFECLAVSC